MVVCTFPCKLIAKTLSFMSVQSVMAEIPPVPEQGQLVRVRQRFLLYWNREELEAVLI